MKHEDYCHIQSTTIEIKWVKDSQKDGTCFEHNFKKILVIFHFSRSTVDLLIIIVGRVCKSLDKNGKVLVFVLDI